MGSAATSQGVTSRIDTRSLGDEPCKRQLRLVLQVGQRGADRPQCLRGFSQRSVTPAAYVAHVATVQLSPFARAHR